MQINFSNASINSTNLQVQYFIWNFFNQERQGINYNNQLQNNFINELLNYDNKIFINQSILSPYIKKIKKELTKDTILKKLTKDELFNLKYFIDDKILFLITILKYFNKYYFQLTKEYYFLRAIHAIIFDKKINEIFLSLFNTIIDLSAFNQKELEFNFTCVFISIIYNIIDKLNFAQKSNKSFVFSAEIFLEILSNKIDWLKVNAKINKIIIQQQLQHNEFYEQKLI